MKPTYQRYEVVKEGSYFFVYDKTQDIYENRHGYVMNPDDGFFTIQEAEKTLDHLTSL